MKTAIPLVTTVCLFVALPGFLPARTLQLDYSTYLGGTGSDYGNALAVDSRGCAYVAGRTASTAFPVENAYQPGYGGSLADGFVSKFSSSGSALIFSTYLGGDGTDSGRGIAVDSGGRVYVAGYSGSSDFPTVNSYQAARAGSSRDAFVSHLTSSGTGLLYSTYLGGESNDGGYGIALDSAGTVCLGGYTESADFPTRKPYQAGGSGGRDAFLARLDSTGSNLVFSTYLGGDGDDQGNGIALDASGCAYLSGVTRSDDFPTRNPYQAAPAALPDAFLCKFSSAGSALLYSTYLGGAGDENNGTLALDSLGCAYLGGETSSLDFPTINPYQSSRSGSWDVFVGKFSSSGTSLSYSTYLGGDWEERGGYVAVDALGCVHLTGYTLSADFPVVDAYQSSHAGGAGTEDAFVSKFSSTGTALLYSTFLGGASGDRGTSVAPAPEDGVCLAGLTQSGDFPSAGW